MVLIANLSHPLSHGALSVFRQADFLHHHILGRGTEFPWTLEVILPSLLPRRYALPGFVSKLKAVPQPPRTSGQSLPGAQRRQPFLTQKVPYAVSLALPFNSEVGSLPLNPALQS